MSLATISLWIACLAFTLFFVWRFTVETKGKTLEEIERGWRK